MATAIVLMATVAALLLHVQVLLHAHACQGRTDRERRRRLSRLTLRSVLPPSCASLLQSAVHVSKRYSKRPVNAQ